MAQTHDTIDGLLAEFRGYAAGMPASYHVTMSWADFRKMLDRFDAAYKREVATTKESLAVGNSGDCAKLREALNRLVIASEGFLKTHSAKYYVDTTEALDKAKAALAEPPRNCDRYATVDEAMEYFADDEALIEEWYALRAGKDRDMLAVELFVFTMWLFAPATEKEGGNDANK